MKHTTDDFLFEIGCEELPAKQLSKLSHALMQAITDELMQAQLTFTQTRYFATPRL
ncbi:MAG: glycine--tRNA ligase subunit beta [Gammaproteobacteria bacterium]|nr:glycine--tRNA ligase subunit beta [Gammaproteobacteria bacterium]